MSFLTATNLLDSACSMAMLNPSLARWLARQAAVLSSGGPTLAHVYKAATGLLSALEPTK